MLMLVSSEVVAAKDLNNFLNNLFRFTLPW